MERAFKLRLLPLTLQPCLCLCLALYPIHPVPAPQTDPRAASAPWLGFVWGSQLSPLHPRADPRGLAWVGRVCPAPSFPSAPRGSPVYCWGNNRIVSGSWAPLCRTKVPGGRSGEGFHPGGSTKQCDECNGARKDARISVGCKGEQEDLQTNRGRERLSKSGTQLQCIVRMVPLLTPKIVQEHLIQHPSGAE